MLEKAELRLPLPPSINHYHGTRCVAVSGERYVRPIVYVKRDGKQFQRDVLAAVLEQGAPKFGDARIAVRIDVHMASNRGDHHNREKPLLDALEDAQVFKNDKQVIDLRVVRKHNVAGGRCHVTIWRID